ncbi:LexA family protein [Sphingomonas sp. SRS2]|uniref:LexA family protein n=1 Tax=Sphingomonas sp. SRS2 TaxID=133190 RepID=UPI0006184D6F|nr:S24 family peptidase [Sphingomonas sp. SRS2]KKC24891.1 hypothetical protein WP12_16825 [Sphingomonas sp. SRS2]
MGRLDGEMEETPAQWVKRRMVEKGLRQVDLANAIGANNPNKISKAFAGDRQFKVHEMDILRALLAEGPPATPVDGSAVRYIPFVGKVPGGNWREAVQQALGTIPVAAEGMPVNAVALKVVGDSMNRLVDDGGYIIFDPDDRSLFPDKFYVIQNAEGETTFKQFKSDPARLVPCSLNPAYQDILIGDQPFSIVGRVIAFHGRL